MGCTETQNTLPSIVSHCMYRGQKRFPCFSVRFSQVLSKVCCREEPDYKFTSSIRRQTTSGARHAGGTKAFHTVFFFLIFWRFYLSELKGRKCNKERDGGGGCGVNQGRHHLIYLPDCSLRSISINGQGTSQYFYTCYV